MILCVRCFIMLFFVFSSYMCRCSFLLRSSVVSSLCSDFVLLSYCVFSYSPISYFFKDIVFFFSISSDRPGTVQRWRAGVLQPLPSCHARAGCRCGTAIEASEAPDEPF